MEEGGGGGGGGGVGGVPLNLKSINRSTRKERESDPAPECRQEWSEARRRCSRWKRTDPPEIAGHKMLPIWRLNLWRVVLLFRLVAAAVVSLSPYIFPLNRWTDRSN